MIACGISCVRFESATFIRKYACHGGKARGDLCAIWSMDFSIGSQVTLYAVRCHSATFQIQRESCVDYNVSPQIMVAHQMRYTRDTLIYVAMSAAGAC